MRRNPTWSAVLALAILGAGCGRTDRSIPSSELSKPIEVEASEVVFRERVERIAVPGTVRARRSAQISSRIVSQITAIRVEVGDRVESGQLLVELDERDLFSALQRAQASQRGAESAIRSAQHRLESSHAALELAEQTYQRFQQLVEKDSVSRQEYDRAAASLRSARAAVQAAQSQRMEAVSRKSQAQSGVSSAQVQLGYARIASPVTGIVAGRFVDPGSLAVPGMALLRIEQAGDYLLEITVPESQTGSLEMGQFVRAQIDALPERRAEQEARIVEMVPEIVPRSRTFLVKLDIGSHPLLRSGLFGRAWIPTGTRQVAAVPVEVVVEQGQIRSVLVLEGGLARRRIVSLGTEFEGAWEVLSGLSPGERVILSPSGIPDGANVQARRRK